MVEKEPIMDIATQYLGIVFHSPWGWGGLAALSLLTLPLSMFFLDNLTQIISDLIVKCNNLLVRRIPIPFVRIWLQNKQVIMLEKSIASYKDAILKIQK